MFTLYLSENHNFALLKILHQWVQRQVICQNAQLINLTKPVKLYAKEYSKPIQFFLPPRENHRWQQKFDFMTLSLSHVFLLILCFILSLPNNTQLIMYFSLEEIIRNLVVGSNNLGISVDVLFTKRKMKNDLAYQYFCLCCLFVSSNQLRISYTLENKTIF